VSRFYFDRPFLDEKYTRRTMLRTATFTAIAIPISGTLLASCAEDADDDAAAVEPEPEDPETEDESTPDDDDAVEPAAGGTLVYGYSSEPENLDPHRVSATVANDWMHKIYDVLVTLNFDLTTIEAGIADSWEISEDGLTYTFSIKENVSFHSGDELTSTDVKYTIERWLDEEIASPSAFRVESVAEVETPDDFTAVFHLHAPNNELLINLALLGQIVNQRAIEEHGDDYGTLFVDGTGPFVFDHWTAREEVVLHRNGEYTWGPPAFNNSGPTHLDGLHFRIIPEDTTRVFEIEAGSIHITPNVSDPDVDRLDQNPDVVTVKGEPNHTTFLGFNLDTNVMSDRAVRIAINHAIDKEMITEDILYGNAEPAHGPVAPILRGALPDVHEYAYDFDPEEARDVLDEAGWGVGDDGIRARNGERLTVKIFASEGERNRELMGIFSSNLRDVGIEVDPFLIEAAAIWERVAAGEHDAFVLGLGHTTADEILRIYFHSGNRPAPNRWAFADPEVDEWLEQGVSAVTDDEWFEAYHNIQIRVIEEAVWAPLYHGVQTIAHHASVTGVNHYAFNAMGTWKLLDTQLSS
jgi:peptide/nickel transport system substrate-binding protein